MPGRVCSFPNCTNRMSAVTPRSLSFHRVPTSDRELRRLWLLALHMEPSTPVEELRREDHKVCSAHFDPDDFYPRRPEAAPAKETKGSRLKPSAVPRTCVSAKVPSPFLWSCCSRNESGLEALHGDMSEVPALSRSRCMRTHWVRLEERLGLQECVCVCVCGGLSPARVWITVCGLQGPRGNTWICTSHPDKDQ